MEFEDILKQIGGFGKFQKKLVIFFVIPVYLIVPWFWLNRIFTVSVPDHWCHVPELEFSNLSMEQKKKLISPPTDASCSMYNVNYTDLLVQGFLNVPNDSDIGPCRSGWEYDTKYYDQTSATKFEMFCQYDYLPSLILTIYSVGDLIGAPLTGFLSDRFGRKIIFFSLVAMMIVTELCATLANNLVTLAILRLLNGLALPSLFALPYILVNEIVVPEVRVTINGIINMTWTSGMTILPLIAYFARDWIILSYINAGSALFILTYVWYIPESPCWLMSRGRVEDSLKIMMRIAKENGVEKQESEILLHLQKLQEKADKEKESEENTSRNFILRYPRLRKHFCILAFCWAAFNVGYSGVTYNMVNLNGNEFVNYFLMGLVEFPGNLLCWYAMDRFGRRWSATVGFFMTGIACLIPIIGFQNSGIVSSLIGKFLVSGVVMVTDQQALELIPTGCRSLALGAGKTVSSIVGLTVPFIAYLDNYGKAIPFLIISFTCFAACALTSFLPETLNAYLPQTILDAEVFGKDQKYVSWIRQETTAKQVTVSTIEDGKLEACKDH